MAAYDDIYSLSTENHGIVTPEQLRVRQWPTVRGRCVPWEACQTFSGSWGYARDEATWKEAPELIGLLVHAVSKGGNLIMNVGPTARGSFDERTMRRLDDYARWMGANARSIYGCTMAPGRFAAPENTILTWNPAARRIYVHLLTYPGSRLECPFGDSVALSQFLHDGSEVRLEVHGKRLTHTQRHFNSGCNGVWYFHLPATKPNVVNPVIEVFLKNQE